MDFEKDVSLLREHIQKRHYISLNRCTEQCQYIPLALSGELLMALNFRDFTPDGYEIVPLSQIESFSHSEADSFFERVVKEEGANAWISGAPQLDITCWKSLLSDLAESEEIAMADIGHEGCANFGRVIEAEDTCFWMRCFSPTAVWDEDEWREPYENLTGIGQRSHYISTFEKYLPPL